MIEKKNITLKMLCLIYIFSVSFMYADPLNILFVVSQFPHISQLFIQDQMVRLIQNGHQIKIHSFRQPKHDKLQSDVEKYNLLDNTTYGSSLPTLDSFDVLYVQFGYDGEEVVKQAKAQHFEGPIFVCFRGNDLSGYLQRDPLRYNKLIREPVTFLPVCSFFKDRLMQLGCEGSKIVVHHSAIRVDDFKFEEHVIDKDKRLNIVAVSRLTEKKGLEYAIKAVAILVKKYPQIQYTIIGDVDKNSMDYKNYLYSLVNDLKLNKHVLFYGWATREEVKEVLAKSDIFVLTSVKAKSGDQEGIPNAAKEAMAVGLPVIVTDHAGNTELVEHKQTGLIVHEKNVIEIVRAIEWYIAHPKKTALMTQKARAFVEEEFAIDSTVAKLEILFAKALAEKRNAQKGMYK